MLSVILPRRRIVVVVVVLVVALVPAPPINSNSTTGCLINTFEVSAPSEVPVLAYISEASPAVVGVLYNDHDDADVRDAVTLTNTMAEHSKVRDRKSTKIPKSLSRQIPEGWNTFTLVVADGNLTIKLVLSEEDHVDLYTLVLKDTVRKMHVEGNVSSCHQGKSESLKCFLLFIEGQEQMHWRKEGESI
ncbi:hypothetical protein GWK47_025797 [Chionoecetes opilio]|uniref:Uncharacterized protein n=1 Tax=Chionoecetes opilio TaxID=41210 RepID=A0A8J8WFF4_CHIOP|nr:hypothetical protein GWK47_025797 [Chionoecetes opilio]